MADHQYAEATMSPQTMRISAHLDTPSPVFSRSNPFNAAFGDVGDGLPPASQPELAADAKLRLPITIGAAIDQLPPLTQEEYEFYAAQAFVNEMPYDDDENWDDYFCYTLWGKTIPKGTCLV
jgi:hypothetical protein